MKRQILSILGLCLLSVAMLGGSSHDCFAQTDLPESENSHDIPDENSDVVARITGEYEMQWAGDMGPPLHATMAAGERLHLVRGLIEITFNDGAVVVLEAPVEFVIDSAEAGTLEVGKLVATVPPEASGFVVNTPSMRIVGMGSTFGAAVDEDGVAYLEVFEGNARAEVVDATTGRVVRTVMLREGSSVQFDVQKTVITSDMEQPDRFPPAEVDRAGRRQLTRCSRGAAWRWLVRRCFRER